MNFDLKDIPKKLSPIIEKLRGSLGFITILIVLGMFGFIVLKIRYYASVQPTQTAVDEKLQGLQRTRIDQAAIDRIENLESTNVDVRALFEEARDNPFQE